MHDDVGARGHSMEMNLHDTTELLRGLTTAEDRLTDVADEVAQLLATADAALGDGPAAAAFRAGFDVTAADCLRGVDDAAHLLGQHSARIRRASTSICDADERSALDFGGDDDR